MILAKYNANHNIRNGIFSWPRKSLSKRSIWLQENVNRYLVNGSLFFALKVLIVNLIRYIRRRLTTKSFVTERQFVVQFVKIVYSYDLLSSALGVLSNSLARLTYSHGIPLESTLSSRPAWGNSEGLWRDVKLVSRQSLCGGVPAMLLGCDLTGLEDESNALISCSISISWTSPVSRASDASVDDAWPEANLCGFTGPRVVTTWHIHTRVSNVIVSSCLRRQFPHYFVLWQLMMKTISYCDSRSKFYFDRCLVNIYGIYWYTQMWHRDDNDGWLCCVYIEIFHYEKKERLNLI